MLQKEGLTKGCPHFFIHRQFTSVNSSQLVFCLSYLHLFMYDNSQGFHHHHLIYLINLISLPSPPRCDSQIYVYTVSRISLSRLASIHTFMLTPHSSSSFITTSISFAFILIYSPLLYHLHESMQITLIFNSPLYLPYGHPVLLPIPSFLPHFILDSPSASLPGTLNPPWLKNCSVTYTLLHP